MRGLVPLGDRAFLARFADAAEAAAWAASVRSRCIPGVVDVFAAYHTAAVYADPDRIGLDDLEALLGGIVAEGTVEGSSRVHAIPVRYDGEDLADVARVKDLSVEEVVGLHSGTEYRVFAVGFLPGFPYAGDLPAGLGGLPRRPSPRTRVPAGSVAIAGRQTGIYPGESPGGWHLLGRTPLRIVDLADGYFPIQAGDRLRFVPIGVEEFESRRGERL